MAQGEYKVSEIIRLAYQAAALLSNAIPVGTVWDETGGVHAVQTTALTSALLAGEKAGGRYLGHFTPDAEGRWTVLIKDKNNAGQVTKVYNVIGTNVDAIGDQIPSDLLVTQSAIAALVASDLLLTQSAVNVAVASDLLLQISSIKSGLLITQSAVNVATASDLLLVQSAINVATASDLLLTQSSVISSVKSNLTVQVAGITSPASVS